MEEQPVNDAAAVPVRDSTAMADSVVGSSVTVMHSFWAQIHDLSLMDAKDEGAPKSAAALMTNMHHLTAPLSRIQTTKPEDKCHEYPKKKKRLDCTVVKKYSE